MRVSHILFTLLFVLIAASLEPLFAQPGYQLDIPKPKPYENRVLKSEKTGNKKFTAPRRFFQNLSTRYNYYFNANNKINLVVDKAKAGNRDDYSVLLPFYNYSLDMTAQDKVQLDSVIYKSQTGIVMHDLRDDWVDNLYLLWAQALYFEKKFDSASMMLQFINYAFAAKEKDGYYKYIGSNLDGNKASSIATKEDDHFPKTMVSLPPSRNSALLWQIRTRIEMGDMITSGNLINMLKNDPYFPERLHPELHEVQAYWFYKQKLWDSAANHLILALDQAQNKSELGRWEYLAAQLFERSGHPENAEKFYTSSMGHTTDPIMEVYARLNLVRINKTGGEHYIDQNIAELVRMAKKDKYADYRDVIYFMAAEMELERNNPDAARELLLKGEKYDRENIVLHNNGFLKIADLAYEQKKYVQAAAFYDSVKIAGLATQDNDRVMSRKSALGKLVSNMNIVERQDSL